MRKLLLATVLGAAALAAGSANATLISIGATTTSGGTVNTLGTDGGTGFVNMQSSSVGTFTLASATATGAPLLNQPTLETSSININSTTAGSLYIFVTEQGLTSPQGINNFLSTFTFQPFNGAITSVVEKTFVSNTNAIYGGSLLASATDTAGSLQTSAVTAATPVLSGLFSETVEYIITAAGAGSTNDTVNMNAVPEPASLALLGASLVGLGALRRRRG